MAFTEAMACSKVKVLALFYGVGGNLLNELIHSTEIICSSKMQSFAH